MTPQRLLVRNRDQAFALAERSSRRDVYKMLERARRELSERLESLPRGMDGRFTQERMRATLAQVETVMGQVGRDLTRVGRDQIRAASERGMEDTLRYLHSVERQYRGVTVPLSLDRAALFDHSLEGVQSTLLRQFPSSVSRYGLQSIAKFERELQQGVLQQQSMDHVVDRLVEQDRFFEGRRYWAERIVRSESMGSYGRSSLEAIQVTREEDWPDLLKVWVTYHDDRTGEDSLEMDGQVRRPDEPFENSMPGQPDVMSPPNRPMCRCVTVAWRPEWPKPVTKKPLWGDVPVGRRGR